MEAPGPDFLIAEAHLLTSKPVMGPEEDDLIAQLRLLRSQGAPREQQEAFCHGFLEGYVPLAREAFGLYHECRARGAVPGDVEPDAFVIEHLLAWRDFFLDAAAIGDPPATPQTLDLSRKLLVGWHRPDFPLWIRDLPQGDVLVLTAREAGWLLEVEGIGHEFYCFLRPRLGSRLVRAFHAGRPVFAMLDYCYEGTVQASVEFLGRPAATPVGVLQLALRFGYDVVFLDQAGSPPEPLSWPAGGDVGELALQINRRIEEGIQAHPSRWLLWAWGSRRWDAAG
jgi:lipid A biosynthesis acyltransferase